MSSCHRHHGVDDGWGAFPESQMRAASRWIVLTPILFRPPRGRDYQDNVDYNVFSGEWLIGRYERNGFRMKFGSFGRYTASF